MTLDPAQTHRSLRVLRGWLIAGIAVAFVVWGLHSSITPEGDALSTAMTIGIAFLVTLTCVVDGHVRGRRMTPIAQFVMLFLWPIATPIYFIWSRGAWGLVWTAGSVVAVFACSWIGYAIAVLLHS